MRRNFAIPLRIIVIDGIAAAVVGVLCVDGDGDGSL